MATFKVMTVTPLDGRNYRTWRVQCQMALMREGLWGLISGGEVEPDEAERRVAYAARRDKALATIVLSVETSLLYLLGDPVDPKIVWERLAGQFQRKSWANKLELRRKLYAMKLTDNGVMQEHVKALTEVMDELAMIDEPVKEEDRVIHLLTSLPPSYDMLVTALEASPDVPKWEVVTERLLHEEKKQQSRVEETSGKGEEEALATRNIRGPRCFQCGKIGHMRRHCPEAAGKFRGPPRDRRSPPRDRKREAYGAAEEGSEDSDEEGTGLLVTQPSTRKISGQGRWIVDSGASSHMCNNLHQFHKFRTLRQPLEVTLGDGHVLKATGRGRVTLEMNVPTGKTRCTLHDVLLVPNLAYNLFSVSKATEAGKSTEFTKMGCNIRHTSGRRLIARGYRQRSLYYLDEGKELDQAHTTTETWHRRFGHLGSQALTKLEKMVNGLTLTRSAEVASGVCVPCADGKQHRTPFQEGTRKTSRVLELVHSDVCGKMGSKSLSGAEYFVTLIDDFSNYTWIYVLKKKSDVFAVFRRWKALVENYAGESVGTLRTDNGGEYLSTEFQQYLKTQGIRHERTIPKTPEQNGKAERLNRTLLESARSMLSDSGLPKRFWAEAVNTATYLRNRSPTKVLSNVTPTEVWTGEKPDVSGIRVFGCKAYSHIPRSERGKLDSKSRKCWMMGYGDTTKGYRLYDPERGRLFHSRDVKFDERERVSQIGEDTSQQARDTAIRVEPQNPEADRSNDDPEETNLDENSEGKEESTPVSERPTRIRREPNRFGDWATLAASDATSDPTTLKEALNGPLAEKWKTAMESELGSLTENEVWSLTNLPPGKNTVGSKWVFKRKLGADGSVTRFKARLVARGFSQQQGRDYDETFSPVVRGESIRALLALATREDMVLHQMDVQTAFLNGTLDEEVYMQQPEGYEEEGREQQVCRLHKSIYGLKQSPRCWNHVLDEFLTTLGFKQTPSDPCLYRSSGEMSLLIAVYVDDLVLAGRYIGQIEKAKQKLSSRFKMKDLGELKHFLGINVVQEVKKGRLWIGQPTYVIGILEKFGMSDSKPVSTPSDTDSRLSKRTDGDEAANMETYQAAVGSLLYLSTRTRPDIAYAVGKVSRFCSNPTPEHWSAVKRILRYLGGTKNLGLLYRREETCCVGYSDADWGGSLDDRKSTSGYVFVWSGAAVTWRSQKQTCVALSTAESEYVALAAAVQEALWLGQLKKDITAGRADPIEIREDNQSAICMATNPRFHSRTKHIDLKYHFVRDHVSQGDVTLTYCPTEKMVADILTKSLPAPRFRELREQMGVREAEC